MAAPKPREAARRQPPTEEFRLDVRRVGSRDAFRVALHGQRILIGRSHRAEVRLDHSTVSRHHAELVRDPFGRWWIRDLSSRNGTLLNGLPVGEQVLRPADRLKVGDFQLRLRVRRGDGRPSAPPLLSLSPVIDLSGDPVEEERTMVSRAQVRAQAEVSLEHLSRVGALGRVLAAEENSEERAAKVLAFLVDELKAEKAALLSLSEPGQASFSAGPLLAPQLLEDRPLDIDVVSRAFAEREPVLAARLGRHPRAVLACPIEPSAEEPLVLYAELPESCAHAEWLGIVALVAETYEQAVLQAELRRQIERHAFVEHELEMARAIQSRLLPSELRVSGAELAIGFRPCRWVGGDHVDVIALSNGRLLLVVADVCGKGLQAALVASSVHTFVRALAGTDIELVTLMARLDAHLGRYVPDDSFVTLVALELDPASGAFEWVGAGHPAPLLVDGTTRLPGAVGGNFLEAPQGIALGLAPGQQFSLVRGQLAPGQTLMLYTDGLFELRSPEREQLGLDGLMQRLVGALEAAPGEPLERARDRLDIALDAFRGPQLDVDDRAFLLVRRVVAERAP